MDQDGHPESTRTPPRPSGPIRVFVVDDSVAYGLLVSAWFADHDQLEIVGNVRTEQAALTGLVPVRPDVVMLDHLLPGPEHSRRVFAYVRAALPQVAVVLISGMSGQDLVAEAAALGADHHVSKATDVDALAEAIHVGVAHRRQRLGTGAAEAP
jgi:DNA-binding NarL/FixJ family response regulator